MSSAVLRKAAVQSAMERIYAIAQEGLSRKTLDRIAIELKGLATQAALFSETDFPSPPADDPNASTHYLLNKKADDSFALYLNSINPGKTTPPHNHTTWAVIVAIEGDERNFIYQRTDDGSDPQHANLKLLNEVVVRPGQGHVAFLADDIHSIKVDGSQATRHLHLYGLDLDRLSGRLSFDLETGKVNLYHRTRIKAEVDAR